MAGLPGPVRSQSGVVHSSSLSWARLVIATRWVGSRRVRFPSSGRDRNDIEFLKERIEAGEYRPVIDRTRGAPARTPPGASPRAPARDRRIGRQQAHHCYGAHLGRILRIQRPQLC